MVCDIALVRHTNVTDDIAAHQTVLAHETELCPVPNYVHCKLHNLAAQVKNMIHRT
jgi:hypothetical protein